MRTTRQRVPKAYGGLTLIELIVVLAILVGLAGLVVPIFSNTYADSAERTTNATLVAARAAMIRQWTDTKYVTLDGSTSTASDAERFQTRWLFNSPVTGLSAADFDPDTRIGWNGPYLVSSTGRYAVNATTKFIADYGATGDPAIVDSFTGSPIVFQVVAGPPASPPYDIRVVSAGANGVLDISPTDTTAELEAGTKPIGDDLYVAFILR
ncbi:MAG: type II secretion system protein [Planctomycetota bacterium]